MTKARRKTIKGNTMTVYKDKIKYRTYDGYEVVKGIDELDSFGELAILEAVFHLADNNTAGYYLVEHFEAWLQEREVNKANVNPYSLYQTPRW